VCKCVLYYCHRVTTKLQLTDISIFMHFFKKNRYYTYYEWKFFRHTWALNYCNNTSSRPGIKTWNVNTIKPVNFHILVHSVHLDIIKCFLFTSWCTSELSAELLQFTLKFTLKQLRHVSKQLHHHQGAHYSCLLICHYRTVQLNTYQQGPINVCSHITTHRCILIGYFNNCNFSKHK